MKLADLPLRERKAGQTRVAIVRALLPRLRERALEDIPVREICAEVGVSEPTFFNHFDGKGAVLPFYVSLWSLGAAAAMREAQGASDGVARLYAFFDEVAKGMVDFPGVLSAIIGHQHRLRALPPAVTIGRADRLVWYGDDTHTLEGESTTVPALISECVTLAHREGALPDSCEPELLVRSLLTLFYGVPAAEPRSRHATAAFRHAVTIVLRGYGVAGARG